MLFCIKMERCYLFWCVCIPVRLCLVFLLLLDVPLLWIPLSVCFFCGSVGFVLNRGEVGVFGGKVWWYRRVHGVFFLLVGLSLILYRVLSGWLLLLDVVFGITCWCCKFCMRKKLESNLSVGTSSVVPVPECVGMSSSGIVE